MLEEIRDYLPILLPLIALQLVLVIVALNHLFRHPNVKRGSKELWIFVILFVNLVGPVLYFLIGKGEE